MTYKDIARLIPTIQSASLLNQNLKTVTKKKKSSKDLIGMGVKNIVGIELIKAESNLIEGL